MNLDTFGGRRFLLCVGCSAVCSVLLWFGKLTDGNFTVIIMGTIGAYVAGDTFQRNSEIKADVQKTAAQAQVDAAPSNAVAQAPK